MSKSYFENIIEDFSYESLENWQTPKIKKVSYKKELYPYQEKAIRQAAKILYLYFTNKQNKELLYSKALDLGMEENFFNVEGYLRPIDRKRGLTNERYKLLKDYYEPTINESDNDKFIKGHNFFNRMAFWMATGSGKSLVLIKMIEYLKYLQDEKLIPEKDIMLLLPRQDLIEQFREEINEYNIGKQKPITLVSLKDYEEDKNELTLTEDIKVYYYRSDLITDERKKTEIDFKDYDNNGNWYVFLDEAHIGETGSSLLQDYVSILSRKGFLFNFSATFTDAIDYATTCYNFNLEKFIEAGYGKNVYLSESYFKFREEKSDFSEEEKQKQVLKSLIVYTLVKNSKVKESYHNPLLVTLVNSINTNESDLLMFFKKIEEIASGTVDEDLFNEAKNDLKEDFENQSYVFGEEKLTFDIKLIEEIKTKTVLKSVFNAENTGKIEILEGYKGKEIVLKLQTSDSPFALIRIGDADKFQKKKLGDNYTILSGYDTRNYFENINKDNRINMLLGSRSFYEGWDSNRPNVINFINIGSGSAKKYVLQAIGRGVRIEPYKGMRKRLPYTNENKNNLLETLFLFATDKKGVKSVLETVEEQKYTEDHKIKLSKTDQIPFELLIPEFKSSDERKEIAYFYLSSKNKKNIKKYFNYYDKNVLILKKGINNEVYNFLKEQLNEGELLQVDNKKHYGNYDRLLDNLIHHVRFKNRIVGSIKGLSDEINHYEYVTITNLNNDDKQLFEEKINKVKNFKEINILELAEKIKSGKVDENQLRALTASNPEEKFKDLVILKLMNHYYLPMIYSEKEKIDYMKNIITVKSEVNFVKSLNKYVQDNDLDCEWMFSKVSENRDNIYIPYYLKSENRYSKFYPDFIFWIKKDNQYKVVFVDPKGTTYPNYMNKIDEFERIFYKEGAPKIYKYENLNVTFDLKLVGEDLNKVPEKYKSFWLSENDFDFLNIESHKT